MEPLDFLTRGEFERLSDEEAGRYVERLDAAFKTVTTGQPSKDAARSLAVLNHWADVQEWVLPPEELDRGRRFVWDFLWERAEQIPGMWEKLLAHPEFPESERTRVEALLEQARGVAEHKRSLAELKETPDT
jgi:hypothetical protein